MAAQKLTGHVLFGFHLLSGVWTHQPPALSPVTNVVNILQACNYKTVKTGLFLKSLVAPSVVDFQITMLFCKRTWYLKVKANMSILNLTTHGATNDLKNRPTFTVL